MRTLDCFGDICPIPLLKLQREISALPEGETLKMVVDHSCAIESIREYLTPRHYPFIIDEVMNGVWEIFIEKTPPAKG